MFWASFKRLEIVYRIRLILTRVSILWPVISVGAFLADWEPVDEAPAAGVGAGPLGAAGAAGAGVGGAAALGAAAGVGG